MEPFAMRKGQRERLRDQREQFESALREKQDRLLELRDECLQLKHQLESYQSMEKQIAGALVEAKAQANRIIEAAREHHDVVEHAAHIAREQAQQEMCAVREQIDQVKQNAREQTQMLEGLMRQAQALAGDTLRDAQPVLQSLKLLGREEDRTA